MTLGEADRAAYLLSEALGLWRGEPFIDLEEWQPAAAQVRRLRELRLEAEELRVEAHLRAGRHREVLAEAQGLVRAAPLRERRWAQLALAEYKAGNQGEALRVIHQLKSVLLQQLGIDPGPDVMALEQAIFRQDESLMVATRG
ncbi:MAG: AfsR/SARP family transcriptional regulator [Propionicimonas sp.]